MKTCINGATTMPYPLEVDIEAAGEAGFQGIEIWRGKLDRFLQTNRKEALSDIFSRYGIGVAAICAFGGYVWCPEAEFRKKLEDARRYFEVAAYIDCEALIVCAEGFADRSLSEAVNAHATRLTELADLGNEYGVRIAMEWFQSLRDAIKVIETVGHEYLGLIIDTFHWYRGDGDLSNVDLTPGNKLYVVHINDCEDLPREELTDKNRLYCGFGVIPLTEILKKLKRLGYEGHLSVEIFREDYWKEDPLAISKKSLETLKDVMKKATVI